MLSIDQQLSNEILDVALIAAVWNDGQLKLAADMAGEWIKLARTFESQRRRVNVVFDLVRAITYQAARDEMRLPGSEVLAV